MALLDDLKTAIKQAIKPNNAQEITGQTLQNTLLQMVDDLGTEAPYTSIAKGVIDLNGQYDILDQYNSFDKKGWYLLSFHKTGSAVNWGGFMLVTADDMGHVIHQFIFSDYTVMDGEIGSHQDGTPSIVVRTYNANSPTIKDIPKGSWGKWKNYLEFPQSEVTGYAVCSSVASIASKSINRTNFELSDNCRLLVEMKNANSAASGVTLNINDTGAKPLFYNGNPVSASNTWQAGDILDVFYDGTNYRAIRFGLGDTYPPLFLTMSKSGTKDVLDGATPIALREALSAGRNVIITDQNQKDNYAVSVSYSPLAITVCNPNGKLIRLDLATDDGIIEYTQTDLSQYSPLVLDIQGNNMPIAGTTTMQYISRAITNKQPLYVNYNNKTNRVIAYDHIQSGSITLYYHDVGYKGIVRVDLIGENTAVPTSRLTPMPKDYDNAALVLDVSNCWHTTSGTSQQYQNVDLGATATEIKAAADGNQRIVLSKGSDRMYPVTAIGMQSNDMIICAMYLGNLCMFTIMPNSGNAQNCDVTLGVTALQTATQTGS